MAMNLAPTIVSLALMCGTLAALPFAAAPSTQSVESESKQDQAPQSGGAPEKPAAPGTTSPATPADPQPSGQAPASTQATKCKKGKSGKCVKNSSTAAGPKKVVVRDGSTSEPTVKLGPTVPSNVASQQLHATEELLNTAEGNLKDAVTRQLNADQSAMVEQVRNYIDQSRSAAKAGDLQRANNLAVKARLLSDELVPR